MWSERGWILRGRGSRGTRQPNSISHSPAPEAPKTAELEPDNPEILTQTLPEPDTYVWEDVPENAIPALRELEEAASVLLDMADTFSSLEALEEKVAALSAAEPASVPPISEPPDAQGTQQDSQAEIRSEHMKILYATSEAAPFCKTGGLADVSGSLPSALAKAGAEVAVILPLYSRIKEQFGTQLEFLCYDYVDLAWRHCYCGLFSLEKDGVTWYFLDNEQYFARPELYNYADDGERFAFFSRAVTRMLDHLKFWPDVIHCNDWQTALIPIYIKDDGAREERFRSIRTVMTIHNVEYQGRYNPYVLGELFGLDAGWANDGTILMDGDANLLKGAVLCADAVTTVSPTYANELKIPFFAHRLDSIMNQCSYKLSGVLNGLDLKRYDPATDPGIEANFEPGSMAGKAVDKANLQKILGLPQEPDTPLLALVSRLVSHKGLDLIREVFHDIMRLPLQFVVLGKGDQMYEDFFRWGAQQYPGRVAVRMDYNEELSMAIYAGADLFLMPSKSEPCGLGQMIAMRYGAVPIVRETGGLRDTVQPYTDWDDRGTGFTFANYSSSDMLYVIQSAVSLYQNNRPAYQRLQQRAMEKDFSWTRSAGEYLNIYKNITGRE